MVLLITPYVDEGDPSMKVDRFQHLGTASIASYLTSRGVNTMFIDASYLQWDDRRLISEIEVSLSGAPVVGLSAYKASAWPSVKNLAHYVKRTNPNAHVCVGGCHATLNYEQVLTECEFIDTVAIGEGERTFYELVDKIAIGESPLVVDGIAMRAGSGIVRSRKRELFDNLDDLPFPTRTGYVEGPDQVVALSLTRGCYSNCSFCASSAFYAGEGNKRFRVRSATNIVEEIKTIQSEFGTREFFFVDDNLTSSVKKGSTWAADLAELLIGSGTKISYHVGLRIDEVDEELLSLLVKSGLKSVFLGIEAGTKRQLNMYRKGFSPDMCIKKIDMAYQLIRNIRFGFILYDPFVTIDELAENLRFLDKIQYSRRFMFNHPMSLMYWLKGYPGTPLYAELLGAGIGPDDNFEYTIQDGATRALLHLIAPYRERMALLFNEAWHVFAADLVASKYIADGRRIVDLMRRNMENDTGLFRTLLAMYSQGCVSANVAEAVVQDSIDELSRIEGELCSIREKHRKVVERSR